MFINFLIDLSKAHCVCFTLGDLNKFLLCMPMIFLNSEDRKVSLMQNFNLYYTGRSWYLAYFNS